MDEFSSYDQNKKSELLLGKLAKLQKELADHEVYRKLFNKHNLRIFMGYHVFAVWDFMTIVKAIQNRVTCTQIPWKPSMYPKELVRFINTIVLDEESDIDHKGLPCDHFSMYVRAMEEIHADTKPIKKFLKDLDYDILTTPIREFVQFNVNIARNYPLNILTGVFYFGRESIIPRLYKPILKEIENSNWSSLAPTFIYYLQRHIELDSNDHSSQALHLLEVACTGSPKAYHEAISFGIQACLLRKKLWDKALESMDQCITEPIVSLSL